MTTNKKTSVNVKVLASLVFLFFFSSPGLSQAYESNPVTTALTGSNVTYNVGPGQAYTEPDTVPWGALVAGDVVNIYYRATPYLWKIGLRGQGTEANPIIINGVTDASGNRPKFNFSGARTASGSNPGIGSNVFNDDLLYPEYGETLGGIVIKSGPGDSYYTYSPKWIQIKNLEIYGAANGNSYTTLAGGTVSYNMSAGLYIHKGEDILIENNVIYDNGFGIFTMAKDNLFSQATKRIILRNNRVYGNGVVGVDGVHNFYVQAANPIVEGNYIGQVRSGSTGSSYKSRSSGEIFRYNYVESSSRAIDFVQSEDQTEDGIITQPDYGTDYVYGNIFVNDFTLPEGGAYEPIHFGGDNLGEQGGGGGAVFDPGVEYRSQLYFWNNTFIQRATLAQSWRVITFGLSLVGTTADIWNNLFVFDDSANFYWVEFAGNLNRRGTNLAYGTVGEARDGSNAVHYEVTENGTLLTTNPLLTNLANQDYTLQSGSPAIDAAVSLPSGVPPSIATNHPLLYQPRLATNGMVTRTTVGSANDLGALENTSGGPPDVTTPTTPASLTATAISTTQINLSWSTSTDAVGVTGYRVYRGGTLIATVTSGTTYNNTGLSASTAYTYTVRAYDLAGNTSGDSTSASATTNAEAVSSGGGGGSTKKKVATTTKAIVQKGNTPTIESLLALLAELQAQLKVLLAQKSGVTVPEGTTHTFTRDLYLGIEGEDVRQLQKYLNAKGFSTKSPITGLGGIGTETTYFGKRTQDALKAFQRAKGLPVTGVLNAATRGAVNMK